MNPIWNLAIPLLLISGIYLIIGYYIRKENLKLRERTYGDHPWKSTKEIDKKLELDYDQIIKS